ncbi:MULTISPECIES: hypothetical protein [Brucella]|nr:hypothetical protein [Brucella pituitosa]
MFRIAQSPLGRFRIFDYEWAYIIIEGVFRMRFCLIAALALSPSIALAEADQDHISYICDHENAIEIITSQDKPEQIILNAFGRERSLEKTTDAPHKTFVGEGYEISFTTMEKIFVTSQGATLTCNVDAIE